MKRTFAILAAAFCLLAVPSTAQTPAGRALYVYDEVNKESEPYIRRFREALAARGIAFDEAAARDLKGRDLSPYDRIVLHGMVMAFNAKSPVRDWLKTGPNLAGKRVYLFVTANRWFLDKLFRELTDLLEKARAKPVDAVSMATKDADDGEKTAAVKAFVEGMR